MTRSEPWSVKGVDDDARRIAQDAASREGLAVGEWIDRAILSRTGAPANEAQPAVAQPPARGTMHSATIEDFEAAIEMKSREATADDERKEAAGQPRLQEDTPNGYARYAVAAAILIVVGIGGGWAYTQFGPGIGNPDSAGTTAPRGSPTVPAVASATSKSGATQPAGSDRLAKLQKAAENGDIEAQKQLGTIHLNGNGVEPNPVEAARWFSMAAQREDPDALYNLGTIYEKGLGVPKNHQKAAVFFSRALAAGSAKVSTEFASGKQSAVSNIASISPAAGSGSMSTTEIADIQRLLARLELAPGEPNGELGEKTIEAIKMYQRFAGLPVDGKPSAALHADLRQVVAAMDTGKR